MKKVLLSTLLFLAVAGSPSAQTYVLRQFKTTEDRGNMAFENLSYLEAAKLYKLALLEDSLNNRVRVKLAETYRLLNQPAQAVSWYEQVAEDTSVISEEHWLHYAEMLIATGRYDKANFYYSKYLAVAPQDRRASNRLAGLSDMSGYFKDSTRYQVQRLPVNSEEADFSPQFYRNGILFVSARTQQKLVKHQDDRDGTNFLDLYYTGITNGTFSQPMPFYGKLNTQYHEGPVVFYNSDSCMIFTRNNFNNGKVRTSNNGVTKLKLFTARQKPDGQWTEATPLPFNSDEFSCGHPAITPDGSTLYFASDMPGGIGGTDIYRSYLTDSGWSAPQNLGFPLNTEGNEMFLFLRGDKLFFSSNGHSGMGGLDVFVSSLSQADGGGISNLGYPINTYGDDFGFIVSQDGTTGYFSSNRSGNDDIYYYHFDKRVTDILAGKVLEAGTLTPIEGAELALKPEGTDESENIKSDVGGTFAATVTQAKNYLILAKKPGYRPVEVTAPASREMVVLMEPVCLTRSVLKQKNTDQPLEGVEMSVVDLKGGSPQHTVTDAEGRYSLLLCPENDYVISMKKPKFFAHHDTLRGAELVTAIAKLNMEEIEVGKAIRLEHIYYDLNKSAIRPDAAKELDKLVDMLKENPTITIELSSHTDSRGSDTHNMKLSDSRAKSAVAYIISQGIEAGRIVARGYGELKLLNKCNNNTNCPEDEHQLNRRTEFKVTAY